MAPVLLKMLPLDSRLCLRELISGVNVDLSAGCLNKLLRNHNAYTISKERVCFNERIEKISCPVMTSNCVVLHVMQLNCSLIGKSLILKGIDRLTI